MREYFHGEERRLEAVIPNYSGTRRGELVVMPWDQIETLGSLNPRDAAIIEAVAHTRDIRDLDPIKMREMCLRCDSEHGIDSDVVEQARRIVAKDDEDKAMVRLSFIAELTRECGIERGDPLMMRANTRTLMELMGGNSGRSKIDLDLLIERVMIFAAERSKSTVAEVKAYLDPLVGMLTPFGNVTAPGEDKQNGFLYLQHTDLIQFRQELVDYQPEVREELLPQIATALAAADECIGFINERLGMVNTMLGSLADMFDKNVQAIDRLEVLRRDIGYGLDGWADMIQLWREAYRGREAIGGERAMERAINRISGYAPRIPIRELDPEHNILSKSIKYETAGLKMVQQMHNWENSQPDYELQARVEKGNKRNSSDSEGN
ncbi:MAG: hypothetical protein P1U88_19280 [Thalassobaculaceae bacterium]|nr:hypothetical protein [Thalassobaculaceae bacterium]